MLKKKDPSKNNFSFAPLQQLIPSVVPKILLGDPVRSHKSSIRQSQGGSALSPGALSLLEVVDRLQPLHLRVSFLMASLHLPFFFTLWFISLNIIPRFICIVVNCVTVQYLLVRVVTKLLIDMCNKKSFRIQPDLRSNALYLLLTRFLSFSMAFSEWIGTAFFTLQLRRHPIFY